MGKDDSGVTAAACRYIVVGLLQRLERAHPGLLAELQLGAAGDRQAMADAGNLSHDVDVMFSEVQRILSLSVAP